MNLPFIKYFFHYIFGAKTRQRLFVLAIFGLFISSFALIVLQGVMGGLQKGVIDRSKEYKGVGHFNVQDLEMDEIRNLKSRLKSNNIPFSSEWEVELLIKNGDRLSPVVLHGVDLKEDLPEFLQDKNFEGVVLGARLASSLHTYYEDELTIITPSHFDFLGTPIPRQRSIEFSEIVVTNQEVLDKAHAWVRLSFIQNMLRELRLNKINFYDDASYRQAKSFLEDPGLAVSWEEENGSLVWALKLETTVMVILFVSMCLLVSVCITSGLMIFYSKVKTDLISFWILGLSERAAMQALFSFTQLMSLGFVLLGLLSGMIVLKILDSKAFSIVPDIFVEQNIPVSFTWGQVGIAVIIPYCISLIFSFYSFRMFKQENKSFIRLIRNVG